MLWPFFAPLGRKKRVVGYQQLKLDAIFHTQLLNQRQSYDIASFQKFEEYWRNQDVTLEVSS